MARSLVKFVEKGITRKKDGIMPLRSRCSTMLKCSQHKEEQQWAIEKPKLDNAGKLTGIGYVDLDDTMMNARKKSDVPPEFAVPCKIPDRHWETRCTQDNSQKTRYACIIEAHESKRSRIGRTHPKDHEDLISEKWLNSLCHYNVVHKPTILYTKQ